MNDLWQKLEPFEVTERSSKLSFVARLAKENDWSLMYAEKVYKEYLRFVYLAATSGQQVTPSENVDQAWHLHLCYSRSYWGDLCGDILGKQLHHGPTKGGKTESNKFKQQYESTLQLYKDAFGTEAPDDIWPSAGLRFSNQNRYVRVNRKDSFIIRKRTVYLTLASIFGVLFLSGCGEFFEGVMNGEPTNIVLGAIGIMFIIFLIRLYKTGDNIRNRENRKSDDSWESGCSGGSRLGGFLWWGSSNDEYRKQDDNSDTSSNDNNDDSDGGDGCGSSCGSGCGGGCGGGD